MQIRVCIPSYRRTKVETLSLIPFARVYVDKGEVEAYRKANEEATIIECPEGIQGSLERVRNYILDTEFAQGADVVLLIDDDVLKISRFEFEDGFLYNDVSLTSDEIIPFIAKYSIMAYELGAKMWGVNVSFDRRPYRASSPFSTVAYLPGPFQCFLKGCDLRYDERMRLKEDYDMSIQQANKYRVVLRVNAYHLNVRQSEQAGGCASYRNREREEKANSLLISKWGGQL